MSGTATGARLMIVMKERFHRQVDEHGWFKDSDDPAQKQGGGVCIHTAQPSFGTWGWGLAPLKCLAQVIHEAYPERIRDGYSFDSPQPTLWDFNDHPDTTMADIDHVYDLAAEAWEREYNS